VSARESDAPLSGDREAPLPEDAEDLPPEDPRELLEELLERIADELDLDAEVIVRESEGVLTGSLEGEDLGLFIGRHGQTIDAVQHLAQRILFRGAPDRPRVVIDADGYRDRRAELLREEADEAAEEAVRLGEAIDLDPLPPSERRLVHEHLRDRGDVSTHSEGDEPERYLVITPLAD
jgi:spoIIIJ-associated protein